MNEKQGFKWIISLIILVILIFCFYWNQLRPNQIIRSCNEQALTILEESDFYDTVKYENMYTACLRTNGLEK
ncbi:MAG: hypothetical protein ABIG10_00655 [bacterium]